MSAIALDVLMQALGSLESRRRELADAFRSSEPFPHIVVDDVFPPEFLDGILEEFPAPDAPTWSRSATPGIQIKLRSDWQTERDIPPLTRDLVHFMNSGTFMTWLASVTGIPHLISDPYYTGGGLNCILPGGLLDVHADGNWHDAMAVHRRLNAIVFLNRDWRDEWGGALELWDASLSGAVTTIAPLFNRLVVFETHDRTYHGHPSPLTCPSDRNRKSLILYYYTATPRPAAHVTKAAPHRALWRRRQMRELP